MKNFILWLAGFFQDQAGTASSKRLGAYFGLFLMYRQVVGSMAGVDINETVFFTVTAFTFAMWGLTIPEWFSPKSSMLQGAKIESSSTTTTENKSSEIKPAQP